MTTNQRFSLLLFTVAIVLLFLRLPVVAQNFVFQSTINYDLIQNLVAVAGDSSNNLWVAGNNRVVKFDANRKRVLILGAGYNGGFGFPGGSGTGPGQFDNPQSLAVDRSGNLYVGDIGNNRIQKFDANGNFLHSYTTDPNFLPVSIAVDSTGTLYSVTQAPGQVVAFDANGVYLGVVAPAYGSIYCIALDSHENLYLFASSKFSVVDRAGNLVRQIANNTTLNAVSAVVDSTDKLYIELGRPTDAASALEIFDATGHPYYSNGAAYVTGLAVDRNDAVYGTYHKYGLDGAIIRVDQSSAPGQGVATIATSAPAFYSAAYTVVDAQGFIYFIDDTYKVRKYDRAGHFLGYFADGQVNYAYGLTTDNAGHIVIMSDEADGTSATIFDTGGHKITFNVK